MAETESHDYWCYHCDKSVAVETLADLPDDVVCFDCKNGFVESISVPAVDHRLLNMLRLIARPENVPPPSSPSYEDFLGLDLAAAWISDDDEEADRSVTAGHEDDGEEHSENNGSDVDNGEEYSDNNGSDDDNGEEYSDDDNGEEHSETESEFEEEEEEENEVIEDEDDQMRVRSISEVLRQRLREIDDEEDQLRARSISEVLRHRLRDVRQSHLGALDWPEVVMDLEQLSDRIRLHVLESDYYVGNPGDYVDAAGYEALLQNLAETDNGGRRGAPPASKAAVEGLETVVIGSESKTTTCAVCRDLVNVGEIVKKLPCGHEYHGDCILPWLDSRNSCPVCRFELPTDDPEYEEERRSRRVDAAASSAISSGGGSDSGLE